MEVIIHKEIKILKRILPEWSRLKKEFQDVTVFQDISWIQSWWEFEQKKREITPYIVEIKKENKTIGIIPLYCSMKKFVNVNFRVLKPIGSVHSDYLIPILSKEHSPQEQLEKAFEKIYEDKDHWDCLDLGDIPEGSVFDTSLNIELSGRLKLAKRKRTDVCPFLLISGDTETVRSKFNKKFLKGLLYYDRKLKREGELDFHKVENELEIEPIMNKFFRLHRKRWENTNTPSKFEDTKEREYAMRAAKSLFQSKLLYLAYLTHNDEIIVAHFGMADGKTNYLYLHAMNMEYRKFPVGHLFVYYLIQNSCKENYEIIDFLRGDEGYKEKWGTTDKFNVEYLFFSRSLKSLLFKMINNTYYSKRFSEESVIKQLLMKTVIRGSVIALVTNAKLRQIFG